MSTPTLEDARERIAVLVERFERNLNSYQDPSFKEAQLRQEFLDPFFEALGWDVSNKQGFAPQYREVVYEPSLHTREDGTSTPDYSFRIGGTRKFFVEAKRPSVGIKDNSDAAFQLRRYAWSANLPLSILTDFEEFAVYEARKKPRQSDKASVERVNFITFDEYPQRLEEIWSVFSKEAVLKGDFDRFAGEVRKKRGTAEVDGEFLKEIEEWREQLARILALRNPKLTVHELNFAVQATIDRILFLRIAEDRGAEDYGRLQSLQNGANIYKRLTELYTDADDKYNAGLFDFSNTGDRLTLSLKIDDKVLKAIISGLYYPDCPYEFSVFSADILGSVYERFLGKVIRLTKGHQAKVEDKPEVKKAGGVYYTPAYIVEYIVDNTAGELIKGKSPKQIEKLKILDPACGSGSFLLGAYKKLLDYHLDWYTDHNPAKRHKSVQKVTTDAQGNPVYRLTTTEKKKIVLNNIFGVDIDPQAVEVAKLNLLLKVMEGETEETIRQTRKLFRERALPNLDDNIKCGNSLVGTDYWAGKLIVDDDERRRINAFDWAAEFPKIIERGGFDVVIGNPPYIQLSMADYYYEGVSSYLSDKFSSSMGRMNTFGLFIERALTYLLAGKGRMSFIVPNTLLTQEYYQGLRRVILKHRLRSIATYVYPVFAQAVVETVVLVIQKGSASRNKVLISEYDNRLLTSRTHKVPQVAFRNTYCNSFLVRADDAALALKEKLNEAGPKLGAIATLNQAIALKHDRSKSLHKVKKGNSYKPVLDGRNIGRYALRWDGEYLAYDVEKIHSCKRIDIFEAAEKLLVRRIGDRIIVTFDGKQHYALNTLVVLNIIPDSGFALKYLLALLNSRLMSFYYTSYLKSTKKVFSEIQARQLEQLPIRSVPRDNPSGRAICTRLVTLADNMLHLNSELDSARTKRDRELIQRQIDATDNEIDKLVYELYSLTPDEIKVVEESN